MNINIVKWFPKGKPCTAVWIYNNRIWTRDINESGYELDNNGDETDEEWSGAFNPIVEFIGYIILEE